MFELNPPKWSYYKTSQSWEKKMTDVQRTMVDQSSSLRNAVMYKLIEGCEKIINEIVLVNK